MNRLGDIRAGRGYTGSGVDGPSHVGRELAGDRGRRLGRDGLLGGGVAKVSVDGELAAVGDSKCGRLVGHGVLWFLKSFNLGWRVEHGDGGAIAGYRKAALKSFRADKSKGDGSGDA
jgi:hypothetical protein